MATAWDAETGALQIPCPAIAAAVANLIVVLEIFYLFTVRYLHVTSFSWRGGAWLFRTETVPCFVMAALTTFSPAAATVVQSLQARAR